MVVAAFSVIDQANRVRFFEKISLVVSVSPDIILGMLFFTLNSKNIDFLEKELWWRSYTIEKALHTIKQAKLVGKKDFAAVVLDQGYETFVVYVASFESFNNNQKSDVHPSRRSKQSRSGLNPNQ